MKSWQLLFMLNSAILALVLLGACSNSQMDEGLDDESRSAERDVAVPEVELDSLRPGMMRIKSNGASVLLGDDRMRVKLDYDYSLGIHEVTCGEFAQISEKETWYFYLDCTQDDLPVTNVSYFDAVLFANAYGRVHGYDSVYVYHRAVFNSKGHCVNLEGLNVRTDVDGFRLPTEAEWVMAASLSWDPERYGWTSANSNYELHAPCAFPDSMGFCDLAGNALELTNDWLGNLGDSVAKNFVGPPTGNALFEKVVKGGTAYGLGVEMNWNNRVDVYPVTASTISVYMGFRLAFGKIPDAVWMDGRGDVATELIKMKAFSSDMREKIGTVHAKLAFRNDMTGNLVYVDFGGGAPGAVEILDSVPVFHPEISPDGKKVAFCTGVEGVDAPSAVYVRNLDVAGSGLVKLEVENAAIPRWNVDSNGDTSIVYVDNTGDNTDDANFLAAATWLVPFSDGRFGVPRKLMDGAYHGGLSPDGSRAVSGARRLRAHVDGTDEIWYDGEQACNASLSKDGSNQTLFLDFGGDAGRMFAHEKYGVHERLLVVDSTGSLVRAIPAPEGYSFDHTEWVDRENWAVASLADSDGKHSKIVLVSIADSSVVALVEGEELWHPNLWVMPRVASGTTYLDLDSAGVYWDPILQSGSKSAALKMRMFWDTFDSLEVIAVGSSRTERGFDPLKISRPAFNFGFIGEDLWGELYLLENYVVPHARNLKYLIVEISPDLMTNDPFARMREVFEQAPGYFYDRNHGFWNDSVPEAFVRLVDINVVYTLNDSTQYVNTRGLNRMESGGWGEDPEIKQGAILFDSKRRHYANVVDSLVAFVDRMQGKGFVIIGLIYPQSPKYADTECFGRHGTPRDLAEETVAYLDSLAGGYPYFVLMDENKFGAHDYPDSMANDYDHLSAVGAERLSVRLDSLIKTLE